MALWLNPINANLFGKHLKKKNLKKNRDENRSTVEYCLIE